MISAEFIITSLIVVLIPGTGVIYTISTGLFMGWRSSLAAATGCTAGILPHLLASILGLSAILHMSALVFQIIKYAGVAYLLYLAWSMWRATGAIALENSGQRKDLLQIAGRGMLINVLNPKLTMFFLAFLPQFISGQAPMNQATQMLTLSGVFMGMTLVVFACYGIFAHSLRLFLTDSPTKIIRIQRTFSAIFLFLGVKLAMTEQ